MSKPYLLVVTGRPGSGKTTFSRKLGDALFMPVISRDQIKEGYVHTFGKRHDALPPEANGIATNTFFDAVGYLLERNISLIAEAAFQHKIWAPMLAPFLDKANVTLLICTIGDEAAFGRFVRRGLDNPLREYFHGDRGVDMARRGMEVKPGPYDEPRIDVPTYHIDTTAEYNPSIQDLAGKILRKSPADIVAQAGFPKN